MPIEIEKKKTGQQTKYFRTDTEDSSLTDILVYEIDKTKKQVIFYPPEFYNPQSKKHGKLIRLLGFAKLPPEFAEKGYIKAGGSYHLNKIMYDHSIQETIISQSEKLKPGFDLKKKELKIRYQDFSEWIQRLQTALNEAQRERGLLVKDFLHKLAPKMFPEPEFSNAIKIKRIMESLDETIVSTFSPDQLAKFEDFFHQLVENKYQIREKKTEMVNKNYLKIESKAVDNIIANFSTLIDKNATEDEFSALLSQNIFIIDSRYIHYVPEINVTLGGHRDCDFGLVDFDYNLDIFEIKRPHTRILATETDRGNYYFHEDMVKAVTQAEKYLYNVASKQAVFERDLKRQRDLNFPITLIRPKAYLIIGERKQLDNEKKKEDFQVLRSSYKNIEIILYDELLNRIKNLRNRISAAK